MADLIELASLTDEQIYRVEQPIILVGREGDCDLVVESAKISRRHCCLAVSGENLILKDLESTNGIRINGQQCKEGIAKVGDEIMIGDKRFQIRTAKDEADTNVAVKVPATVESQASKSASKPTPSRESASLSQMIDEASQAVLKKPATVPAKKQPAEAVDDDDIPVFQGEVIVLPDLE